MRGPGLRSSVSAWCLFFVWLYQRQGFFCRRKGAVAHCLRPVGQLCAVHVLKQSLSNFDDEACFCPIKLMTPTSTKIRVLYLANISRVHLFGRMQRIPSKQARASTQRCSPCGDRSSSSNRSLMRFHGESVTEAFEPLLDPVLLGRRRHGHIVRFTVV